MTAVQIIKISCKVSGLSKLMQLKEINKIYLWFNTQPYSIYDRMGIKVKRGRGK